MITSATIRDDLTRLLRLDLVGPRPDDPTVDEAIEEPPSRWYLTGFLVPVGAKHQIRADESDNDDIDGLERSTGVEDGQTPDATAKRKAFFPSSMGLSVLVPATSGKLRIQLQWGEYAPPPDLAELARLEDAAESTDLCVVGSTGDTDATGGGSAAARPARPPRVWRRRQRVAELDVDLRGLVGQKTVAVKDSDGLQVLVVQRPVADDRRLSKVLPAGTRSLSVFFVNKRDGAQDRDGRSVFQAGLRLQLDAGFVARPDMRGAGSLDIDDRVAALQYRNVFEFAVGHNVGAHAVVDDGQCQSVETTWLPQHEVARVVPGELNGLELSMEALAEAPTPRELQSMLERLPEAYGEWLALQRASAPDDKELLATADQLLNDGERAKRRIEQGIALLTTADAFDAFRIANRAMAKAARQQRPDQTPTWRLFQLAFVLLNLPGLADGAHDDRKTVELLFFPTGGGKTEAYLGIAAFTLVLRRLRNPGVSGAGVSVIMRYTLRLLTLDQLTRAAALICALELLRDDDKRLGDWPFEIGLWVGLAATPNRMGRKGDNSDYTARFKVLAYQRDEKFKASPIPLDACPWCRTPLRASSFKLDPNSDDPTDLRITCANPTCVFTRNRRLPVVAVDEPLYRRLPCFLIATVDKFAALPWTGQTGALFGKVTHYLEGRGFYGPSELTGGQLLPNGRLPAPDLIIQDELHLISGPLGTMAGLYEAAIETLATTGEGPNAVVPKIIASTATVRRAQAQIQALFGRTQVAVFPPPGPNLEDLFFAKTLPVTKTPGRRYLGVAAPGRSQKVVLLRVYVTLLAAAQAEWERNGGARNKQNPTDPYMTLLGYFNSLRELGGSRRIVEDEVRTRLHTYARRSPESQTPRPFANRRIGEDVFELTSRVSTDRVAKARARLACSFDSDDAVDVALATNMISVGLDITRLGLMVVLGQPKTTAEYIQTTSRVGRDPNKPGLIVTLFNVHRPRDRSHYERFEAYHQSFYRAVEVTSVTPFSPRAVDRVLPAVVVALARLGRAQLTSPLAAIKMVEQRQHMDYVLEALTSRLDAQQSSGGAAEVAQLKDKLRSRIKDLLDTWSHIAEDRRNVNATLEYAREEGKGSQLIHEPLSPKLRELSVKERKFVAPRSMRNVEPAVDIWVSRIDGQDMPDEVAP